MVKLFIDTVFNGRTIFWSRFSNTQNGWLLWYSFGPIVYVLRDSLVLPKHHSFQTHCTKFLDIFLLTQTYRKLWSNHLAWSAPGGCKVYCYHFISCTCQSLLERFLKISKCNVEEIIEVQKSVCGGQDRIMTPSL